jgi:hypothetical protein
MRRVAVAIAMMLASTGCSDDRRSNAQAEAPAANMVDGPVPDGTIVDLPMDSISNQDMVEGNEDAPFEGQVVESDR